MEKRGRHLFKKYKKILILFSKIINKFPMRLRKILYSIFRNTPGKIGIACRYIIIKSISETIGDNVSIFPNVYILNIENISIGDNVSIHQFCYLECSGGIVILDNVSIAHGVSIISETHNFLSKDIEINNQGITLQPIKINSNVWIGAKSTILGNVTIGYGSIIGANSVVTKSINEYVIAAGCPAKIIRER